MEVLSWSCSDVSNWLISEDFGRDYEKLFFTHRIDGVVLLSLTEADLRNPPLSINVLGDIKKLWMAIRRFQVLNEAPKASRGHHFNGRNGRLQSEVSECSLSEEELSFNTINRHKLKPEYLKLFLSYIYMSMGLLMTAYVMVVVHDRVPDMTTYPPLPDLMLDNIPHIPWAFQMCEVAGVILMSTFLTILVFHKHRYIILSPNPRFKICLKILLHF